MSDRVDRRQDEKGLSARYLILVFLVGVAACAIFFSLGFLVGYNERTSRSPGPTEQVTPTGVIPPTVNPPLDTVQTTAKETRSATVPPIASPPPAEAAPEGKASSNPTGVLAPPPNPRPAARAAASSSPARGSRARQEEPGFTVQVAASREKADAEKLVKELKARGFAVFVVMPEYSEAKDSLYRVQVGPFATREEAVRVRDRIAKEGFKPFIKR